MAGISCPICDEGLTSPPPNYQAETARAQEMTGEPVVVGEVPGPSPRAKRGRPLGVGLKRIEKPPKVGRSTAISTPCGHLFHVACIEEWFKNTNPRTCPTCRKPCPPMKMVPIFPVVADLNRSGSALDDLQDQPSTSAAARLGGRGLNTRIPVVTVADPEPAPAQNQNAPDEDLRQMHNMLMQDYEELQGRYNDEVDRGAMGQAITNSLQTMCDELKKNNEALKNENEALKNALGAHNQTGNSVTANTATPNHVNAPTAAAAAPATPARRGKAKQATGSGARGRGGGARAGTSKADPSPTPDSPTPKRARRSRKSANFD